MLVDRQSELMSDLLFAVHQHGADDVTSKPPILRQLLQDFDLSLIGNMEVTTRSCKETVILGINLPVNSNVAIFSQLNSGRNYCSDNYNILVKAIAT